MLIPRKNTTACIATIRLVKITGWVFLREHKNKLIIRRESFLH